MDAARALIVLLPLAAGCSAAPRAPERTFVHPASATDVRLLETLEAAPADKTPPTALEIALKLPLIVPTVTAMWVRDTPRAIVELALTPVAIVAFLLEEVGILKRERDVPFEPRERDR